jgi:DNA-binding HxlR family transcriptional regulator
MVNYSWTPDMISTITVLQLMAIWGSKEPEVTAETMAVSKNNTELLKRFLNE